jgi:hypothetical protein
MADKKISALTAATTPLAGTEVLPIVQSGVTVKVATNDLTVRNIRANATTGILQVTGPANASTRVVTVPDANFTAARTDAAQSFTGNQTLSTGNLVIGTSGGGIDFSITSHPAGMTSELLADYEEGTWDATLTADTGTITASTFYQGKYTKVGRQVTVSAFIVVSSVSSPTGELYVNGLPYANGSDLTNRIAATIWANNLTALAVTSIMGYVPDSGSRINISRFSAGSNANDVAAYVQATTRFYISATYFAN